MYGAYYLGGNKERRRGRLVPYDAVQATDMDLHTLNQVFRTMADDHNENNTLNNENSPMDYYHKSLADYLSDHHIPSRMQSMAVAGYGNTAGCSNLSNISYAAS